MLGHASTKTRRGVLLLIVLSVLALFALLALSFVLIATHFQQSARLAARASQQLDSPDQVLDEAFHQVVRGSRNSASVLAPHSILEDMYGSVSFVGTFQSSPTAAASGQLIELPTATLPNPQLAVGRVLTVTKGVVKNLSTRIVGVDPATGAAQALPFENGQVPAVGDEYILNGTPYSGTGFGYSSLSGDLSYAFTGGGANWPYALLPNQTNTVVYPAGTDPAGAGGANEDYDAVDYQNMALAMLRPDGTVPIPSLHRPELVNYWKNVNGGADWSSPNLRRSTILRPLDEDHAFTDLNGNGTYDPGEPGFTGRAFNPVTGPWDVDNDGDGKEDSVWVDLGFPARARADGRVCKPLVAILCVDLDGRLNLNAHGCLTQTDTSYYGPVPQSGSLAFSGTAASAMVPRGQGYGTAEINLLPLFPNAAMYKDLLCGASTACGSMDGRYGELGLATTPGPGRTQWISAANLQPDPLAWNKLFQFPRAYNPLTVISAYGTRPDLKGSLAIGLDVRGQPAYCLLDDPSLGASGTGADALILANSPYELNLARSSPHGVPTPASDDNPFSPAELERVLRSFDADAASLPNRLTALTTPSGSATSALVPHRNEITTEAWDLPSPTPTLPYAQRSLLPAEHLTRLLVTMGAPPASLSPALFPPELLANLQIDLNPFFGDGRDNTPSGQRGVNVVDEPAGIVRDTTTGAYSLDATYGVGEVSAEVMPQVGPDGTLLSSLPALNHTNGVDVNGDGLVNDIDKGLSRQLYARYIYVLLMLLGKNYSDAAWTTEYPGWSVDQARAHTFAQWAVNIVDFCDSDSIMTPFEYDMEPFVHNSVSPGTATWEVDGVIGTTANPSPDDTETYRGLVWGCERPELLITETFAFHDRRTQDRADEQFQAEGGETATVAGTTTETDTNKKDLDFDQKLKPQGSLFVELFNPWATHDLAALRDPSPAEFYFDTASGMWKAGVDLTKTVSGPDPSAPSTTITIPVWRMIVVTDHRTSPPAGADYRELDPDSPIPAQRPPDGPSVSDGGIERAVYFVHADSPKDAIVDFYPQTNVVAPVPPGGYALVGPGEAGVVGRNATHIGLTSPPSGPPVEAATDRMIVLDPTNATGAVAVTNNGTQSSPATIVPAPVAIVIDKPHRLSVSEPAKAADYYPLLDPAGGAYTATTGGYPVPYDQPLDKQKNLDLWNNALKDTKTHSNFCVIHLQRLANPLAPWDPNRNPYRTVDSVPVDLTTFNGVDAGADPTCVKGTVLFSTRERGEAEEARIAGLNDLWRHEPTSPKAAWRNPRAFSEPNAGQVFQDNLQNSLGYLNSQFGAANALGFPTRPFPWFTWNNRPYISQYELALVPSVRSSRLLGVFAVQPNGTVNPYDPATPNSPFPHLLNIFQSDNLAPTSTSNTPPLARLLELVHVPSKFVGTELQGDLAAFAITSPLRHYFNPPFNRVPEYREPGRVNINTIFSPDVWQGVVNYLPDLAGTSGGAPTFWNDLVTSRQGYSGTSPDPAYPTRFARPFRSMGGSYLVPLDTMKPSKDIDATLLRAGPSGITPLFAYKTDAASTDTDRNPYFQYELLRRLGNLGTTRSNVYAIWITVGYFEATSVPRDVAHPDGYRLGKEVGLETGEVKRHRGFYILDRSIPVGFQRGEDLNVDKAVLIKRFIE